MQVPVVPYAFIGGSGTFSLRFPEDLDENVEIVASDLVFKTPYGDSPRFKLVRIGGKQPKEFLTVKMHGRRWGVPWRDSARQVFWVLREAGVKKVLSEGGVGGINHLLDTRDIVIPSDYIDFSLRRDVGLDGGYLLIMREALCPELRRQLTAAARHQTNYRVFDRGIYLVTDGHHFESRAEIAVFRQWNADVVGQSLCPEVYLAREINACYASLNLVVNHAEGVVRDWEHEELKDIFFREAAAVGRIILATLQALDLERNCSCPELRKPTLLQDESLI